jgi:hypothetical protein
MSEEQQFSLPAPALSTEQEKEKEEEDDSAQQQKRFEKRPLDPKKRVPSLRI